MTCSRELPDEWRRARRAAGRSSTRATRPSSPASPRPSRNDEYLFYQTLSAPGRWASRSAARARRPSGDRMREYMLKAIKEAKVHTSWTNPDADYEEAVRASWTRRSTRRRAARSSTRLRQFKRRLERAGQLNSLGQVVLSWPRPACRTSTRAASCGTCRWWIRTTAARWTSRCARGCSTELDARGRPRTGERSARELLEHPDGRARASSTARREVLRSASASAGALPRGAATSRWSWRGPRPRAPSPSPAGTGRRWSLVVPRRGWSARCVEPGPGLADGVRRQHLSSFRPPGGHDASGTCSPGARCGAEPGSTGGVGAAPCRCSTDFPVAVLERGARDGAAEVWPGRPYPLGATWDGEGVNFAVFSRARDGIEVCLFDPPTPAEEPLRITLPERPATSATATCRGLGPGTLYGLARTGRTSPNAACASTRTSCWWIPTPAPCTARWTSSAPVLRLQGGRAGRGPRRTTSRDSARRRAARPWCWTTTSTGGRRPPPTRPLGRDASSTSCT